MQEPQPVAQLVITQMNNGAIQVQGPLENKGACYALLELAKDAIRDHVAEQQRVGGLTIVRDPLPQNGTGA